MAPPVSTPLPTLITGALLLALPITLALSCLVDWRYRSAVLHLMRLAPRPGDADAADPLDNPLPSWRKAQLPPKGRERRLTLALAGLSLLIGFTTAVLYLLVHSGSLSPLRLLITALVVLSRQVVQCQGGVRPLRVEVRLTNPGLTHPCIAIPMPD
jgi:hypothetical protein